MRSLLILLGLAAPDMTARVATEAAVTINQPAAVITPVKSDCCGECKGGWITHGDGHRTPCPCPATCKCKAKPQQPICESGTCALRK